MKIFCDFLRVVIPHHDEVLRGNECRIFRWIYFRRAFDRLMISEREHRGEHQREQDYLDFDELTSTKLREYHIILMHRIDS